MTPRPKSLRLWLATILSWLAARSAPREMRPVFRAYCDMLAGFPAELEKGRTYGIVTAIWTRDPAERGKARLLQDAAIEAATKRRGAIEAVASLVANGAP